MNRKGAPSLPPAYSLSPSLTRLLKGYRDRIEGALAKLLPDPHPYARRVREAMRYSLMAGGKRLRPLLCLLACRLVGGRALQALPVACAFEYIHTYSLIHDDLPALDNDDFRRGRPSCHKKFGESTAILAGDALLTEAFHLVGRGDLLRRVDPRKRLAVLEEMARAAGAAGMIGGQEADLFAEHRRVSLDFVTYLHNRKTGALITAALVCGALVGGADARTLKTLRGFGNRVGLAFQIRDDLLNIVGESRLTGKATGSDASRAKATYPSKVGLKRSQQKAQMLVHEAEGLLRPWGTKADPLLALSRYIIARDR